MRIGVMLRAYDRSGGIGIYSRNIIKHILRIDKKNDYILLYNNKDHIGIYSEINNVAEIFLPKTNAFIWDQWLVPKVVRKYNIDLIFNTKFSVPLITKAKCVMILHGAGWFRHPEFWGKFDVFYQKIFTPVYLHKSDFLISNSNLTTNDFQKMFNASKNKIGTVYLAAGEQFKPVSKFEILDYVKKKYNLPPNFIFTVTSYDPLRKNFKFLLESFKNCRKAIEVDLVVIGKDCHRYMNDFDLKGKDIGKYIHFPGWVDQKDLPAIYSLGKCLFFPSIYETFGIPVVEAMSCGCPVVSSTTGAIPELCGEASLLCNPHDVHCMTDNLLKVLLDVNFADKLKKLGLEQSKKYSWEKSAEETIKIFNTIIKN